MKKKYLLFRKDYLIFSILGIVFSMITLCVGLNLLYLNNAKTTTLLNSQITVNDSLNQETAQLRQLLESKLESLCDTSTIEEKLAQAELEAFRQEMYREQNAETDKAYNKKEAVISAAHDEKTSKDMATFDDYYATRCRALRELEKEDPSTCDDYVVAVYKADRCAYTYEDRQELRVLEDIPAIARYLRTDQEAWKKRKADGAKLDIAYDQQKAKINQDYQNLLKVLEQFYEFKIAEKKKALGL